MRSRDMTNSLVAIVSMGNACGAVMAIPGLLTVHVIMWATDPIDRWFDRRHILVTRAVGILIEQSLAPNKSAIVDAPMVEE